MSSSGESLQVQIEPQTIQEGSTSVIQFCFHVFMFILSFVVVVSVILALIFQLRFLSSIEIRVDHVNKTYPLDHGQFLPDTSLQREGHIP